jgi:hypothetical protein
MRQSYLLLRIGGIKSTKKTTVKKKKKEDLRFDCLFVLTLTLKPASILA